MAEKKDETKTVPEVTYTVDEYAENPQVLEYHKILSEQHLQGQVLKKQRRAQQRNL